MPPGRPDLDDWFVDEVGIAFGVIGPWRLKTLYQPIYERRGDLLDVVAVGASSVLERSGRRVPPGTVCRLLTVSELWQARRLAGELAIRNLVLLGSDDPVPDTIVPAAFAADRLGPGIDHLLRLADLESMGASKLVLDLSGTDAAARCRAVSRPGTAIRHALDLASASEVADASAGRPEVLRVPAEWTRQLIETPQLALQMRRLATAVGREGRRFQVEGVDSGQLLRAALAGGAERLQGTLLAAPFTAGTELDRRALPLPDLLSRDGTDEITA
jgi:hypothetical protein